jgi:2,4-dienoyl-CoA reductase-like NADH-dependent reductase (Old Yellow Enzyme family)
MRAAWVGEAAGLGSVVEGIDVAVGRTARMPQSVCGRAGNTSFSDCIGNDAGVATTMAGDIDRPDRVNSLPAADRAHLRCFVRPHLVAAEAASSAAAIGDRQLTSSQPPCAERARLYPPAAHAAPATEKV